MAALKALNARRDELKAGIVKSTTRKRQSLVRKTEQTEKMKERGLFSSVNDEVGQIIVADVNKDRVKALLDADKKALTELING